MSPSAAQNPPIASREETLLGEELTDDDSKPKAKDVEASLPSSSSSSSKTASATSNSPSLEDNQNIHLSSHPVLFHKITSLRSEKTPPGTFRSLLRQVTYHLGYEATKNLSVRKGLQVIVPLGKECCNDNDHENACSNVGVRLVSRVALIPILRSGLGMTDAMLELLPNAAVHHIGMYRTPGSNSSPIQYFNRLPRGRCMSDVAYVLDPIVGSATTAMAVVSILKKWGVPNIHVVTVVASKAGLERLAQTHPEVSVTVGMVDKRLTESGIVLPGLGDVGDRLFGLGNYDFEDGTATEPLPQNAATGGAASSAASACSDDSQRSTKRKRSVSLELELKHSAKLL